MKGVLFGLRDVPVSGRSTDVSAAVSWSDGGSRLRVEASVHGSSFDSGRGRRDRHVAGILSASEQPTVGFSTEWVEAAALREALAHGGASLPGHLELDGRRIPLSFELRLIDEDRPAVEGRLATTFSALDLEVPDVAGGLVASAREDLELFVRLPLDHVAGASGLIDGQTHALSPEIP